MNEVVICKQIKCKDYSTDDGEPAWCNRAGCPAVVAMNKCPKASGNQNMPEGNGKTKERI
jgi:hypothetical protein